MNTNTTITRFFPNSYAREVHQTGELMTNETKGVEVYLHTRENEVTPYSAEILSGDHYADIGLSFEGLELVDFDGVFSLPREVGLMLKEAGLFVPDNCFA